MGLADWQLGLYHVVIMGQKTAALFETLEVGGPCPSFYLSLTQLKLLASGNQ